MPLNIVTEKITEEDEKNGINNVVKELISLNNNLIKLPREYLNYIGRCVCIPQLITLDWAEVKEFVKHDGDLIYDYLDYSKKPTKSFLNKIKTKYKNSKLIIIYILNIDIMDLKDINNYELAILKIKNKNDLTYGSIVKGKSFKSKILMVGITPR